MWKIIGVVGMAIFVLTGCSDGRGDNRAASPSAPADSAAADDASANRVLAGLDGVIGDLQRIVVRERRITPDITDRLQAVYTGPELLNQIDALKVDVSRGLAGYRSSPGNRLTVVSRVISAQRDCMFAEVKRDYSPVSSGPAEPPATLYVILVSKNAADDPKGYNPTAWAMLYDGVQEDGSEPENVCR